MKSRISLAILLCACVGSASAFYQHIFEVNGVGATHSEARQDARDQAKATCDGMGGTLMLEEIQTYPSGGLYIFHGLAHCNIP